MRHPRRMFGERRPCVCEYLEELVESRRRLDTEKKSGCGEICGFTLEWKK